LIFYDVFQILIFYDVFQMMYSHPFRFIIQKDVWGNFRGRRFLSSYFPENFCSIPRECLSNAHALTLICDDRNRRPLCEHRSFAFGV